MLVLSFARGHHMYCFLQLRQQLFIDKTFNFINFMWRTATKSFIRRTLFIPPCPTVRSWKCVAVLSRRYARGAIWRKTVYKLLKWRHWRVKPLGEHRQFIALTIEMSIWNLVLRTHVPSLIWAIPAETTILPSKSVPGPWHILFLQILYFFTW